MMTDIKVGDKVRLTENYKMAFDFSGEGVVIAIMDECGLVALRKYHTISWISLCDLIKVEEEKKDPKFKRGDKVVSKPPFVEKVWTVFGYDDKMPYMVMVGDGEYINERNLEPYTEPTERTEAEKPNVGSITIPVEVELTDSFWDAYTADLAKEIAIVYAKQKRDVRLAVRTAKSVVEELKKK